MKATDHSKATQHAKALPKFGDIVMAKQGVVPFLSGPASHMRLIWNFSQRAKEEQVVIMNINGSEYYVSRQALEHFLRAVE